MVPMADGDEGGAGHKLGIGAAILAAVGGLARMDDCGRAALKTTALGDDVARGGVRLGDDVARGGLGVGDDVSRAARGAHPDGVVARAVGLPPATHVVDDVAPGAGGSIEEALGELGLDLALEVVSIEVPDGGDAVDPAEADARATPVPVLAAATWEGAAAELEAAAPGSVVAIVGATRADGTFALGTERVTDLEVHARCHARGVRCVVATCPEGGDGGCVSLAAGMGRKAAAVVPATGGATVRSVRLVDALLRERAALRAHDVAISRLDADGGKVVRSRIAPPPAPRP